MARRHALAALPVALVLVPALVPVLATDARAQIQTEVESPDIRAGGARVMTAPADVRRAGCRLILTRLVTEIPPWDAPRIWPVTLFADDGPTPEQLADRTFCLGLLDEPVVRFDDDLPPTPTWPSADPDADAEPGT